MLIVMQPRATAAQLAVVADAVRAAGLQPHAVSHRQPPAIAVTGGACAEPTVQAWAGLGGVAHIEPFEQPFGLVSWQARRERTVIDIDGVSVGGRHTVLMAGPCAVEGPEQLLACAHAARRGGAQLLRGGAFKPRTSPYAFQGLGVQGLALLAEARQQTGLKIVTEVISTQTLDQVAAVADVLQIGARNMHNFALLQAVGAQGKPVLLKRGLSATYQELLMAAEYIAAAGNCAIMLCERGIRTFEPWTRNTLDLAAVPLLHELSHLPVVVDPSHGTGRRNLVGPMAQAALAAGADGVLLEIHPNPDVAWSDGPQSLPLPMFAALAERLGGLAAALDRPLAPSMPLRHSA